MHQITGSCHCGNVNVSIGLPRAPLEYSPRACDCDFCRKHGASYLSDPNGVLAVEVGDLRSLHSYRQGSGTAEMLVCGHCGVLIGATFAADGRVFAAINTRIIDGGVAFGESRTVSPKLLGAEEKAERWRQLWFGDVSVGSAETPPARRNDDAA